MSAEKDQPKKEEEIFQDLTYRGASITGASNERNESEEEMQLPIRVESMCVNCEENGETRLLMVRIPHFREVIVSSFGCEHCGFKNHEVQFGGSYADQGVRMVLRVLEKEDLNRQLVKSDYATLEIPDLGFEIPAKTQRGCLNTLEGILGRAIDGISEQQPVRKALNRDVYEKLEGVIAKLRKCMSFDYTEEEIAEGKEKGALFNVILTDPSGNSNIENLKFPESDPQISSSRFNRTLEDNKMLGLGLIAEDDENVAAGMREKGIPSEREARKGTTVDTPQNTTHLSDVDAARIQKHIDVSNADEIVSFTEPCYNCEVSGSLKMLPCRIPHFKEIILMAFNCEHCGYRSNEVKAGGSIPEKGRRIKLRVETAEDLARDFLKADTAKIEIPEAGLNISEGSLGGRFTTVEGIIRTLVEQLENMSHFEMGDSTQEDKRHKFVEFLKILTELADGKKPFTIIVDDPVSNSYIQNLWAPDPDPQLDVEDYERSWEQNEVLGLNDMNA